MDFKKDIFEKGKKFLLDPKAAFDKEVKSDVIDAFKYMIIWLFITAILTATVFGLFGHAVMGWTARLTGAKVIPEITSMLIITTFFSTWIGRIVGLTLGGLWLHLWAYLLGARMKIENTFKTVFYGSTPRYVIGWIPFISIIAEIWSMVLFVFGLVKLQKLSTGEAILAIILAIIIPLVVLAVIASSFLTMFAGIAGMSGAFSGV